MSSVLINVVYYGGSTFRSEQRDEVEQHIRDAFDKLIQTIPAGPPKITTSETLVHRELYLPTKGNIQETDVARVRTYPEPAELGGFDFRVLIDLNGFNLDDREASHVGAFIANELHQWLHEVARFQVVALYRRQRFASNAGKTSHVLPEDVLEDKVLN